MPVSLLERSEPRWTAKLARLPWGFVALVCVLAAVGCAMLYSAGDGSMSPWAYRHLARFMVALGIMLAVAAVDIRIWFRLAWGFYFGALILLAAVEVAGSIGMGAQRWIDLGVVSLQPSELMKVALVLGLARYFHGVGQEQIGHPAVLIMPVMMVVVPVALVLKQPDLGTAVMLLLSTGCVLFCAGVRLWVFAAAAIAGLASLPVAWQLLHDYQRKRVLTFLDPEQDPLGAGYHIIQSKIALGSGGVFGKGFLKGTQSHLNFLPEKQTDFIFTMYAEEFGLVGALGLLALYALLVGYCLVIAVTARSQFGRLVAIGMCATLFCYVFINVAMVMGLIPVVGVPLPLVSYGGTAMLSLLVGLGLVLSVALHRDVPIPRYPSLA